MTQYWQTYSINAFSIVKAIDLFKRAGNSLMLTVKVKDDRKRSGAGGLGGGHYDPLAHPPDNFELLPHDFDIDAEITSDVQLDYHSAFMLKPREGEQPRDAKQSTTAVNKSTNRLPVLDMDAVPSKGAPMIASPAALGYGPTLALPTLTQMAKATTANSSNDDDAKRDDNTVQDQDTSLLNVSGHILDASITSRHSVDFTTVGDVPASLAHLFNRQQQTVGSDATQGAEKFNLDMNELQSKQEEMLRKAQQKEREESTSGALTATVIPEEDDASKKLAQDYKTYQFPVEEDEEEAVDAADTVVINKKPSSSRSAMKKVSMVTDTEVSVRLQRV